MGTQVCPALEISLAACGRDIFRRVSRTYALWSSEVRDRKGGPCGRGRARKKKEVISKCDQAKRSKKFSPYNQPGVYLVTQIIVCTRDLTCERGGSPPSSTGNRMVLSPLALKSNVNSSGRVLSEPFGDIFI